MDKSCKHCGHTYFNRGNYCPECFPLYVLAQRLILKYLTKELGKLSLENCQQFKMRNDFLLSSFDYTFDQFLKEIKIGKQKFNTLANKIKGVK